MIQDFKNLTHLLRQITARIPKNTENLQEILRIAPDEICRGLDVDCVQIYRETSQGKLVLVAESHRQEVVLDVPLGCSFGTSDRHRMSDRSFELSDILSKTTQLPRQCLNERSTPPTSSPKRSTREIRNSVCFSLRLFNKKWGYLRVERSPGRSFSLPERQLLQLLANQLAIGIERCKLRQQVWQQTQRNDALDRLGSLLQASRGAPENLQRVLEEIVVGVNGIGGRLYLQSQLMGNNSSKLYTWGEQPSDPQLEIRPSWHAWLAAFKTCTSREQGDAVASHPSNPSAANHQTPFPSLIVDFQANALPQPLSQAFASTRIGSILTIALNYGDRSVGYLSVFRSGKPTQKAASAAGGTHHRQREAPPHPSRTASWSVADVSFIQSASLHLYLWLVSQHVQSTLEYQASHDLLTRLPNRKQFEMRLEGALGTDGGHLAIAILDLDGFKRVNYTLGHPVGDRLLVEVTQRLQGQLPSSAYLARWGDDRFTILLDYNCSVEELTGIFQTVLSTFCHPFLLGEREIYITGSLGVAIAPHDGDNVPALLRNAEVAMHQAKRLNQNSYQFYASGMNRSALAELVLETDLRKASIRNEFWLDYQPQLDLTTGQIVGMEALIRWRHPTLGMMPPDRFIGLAEETGLICPIGEWVLRTACLQQRSWQQDSRLPVRVAVNLSTRQLQPDLVATIAKILHDTQMNPQDLELEITESVAVQNIEMTIAILREFQDMGVTVALDDFGTGYSCLSAVEQLPLNVIKIDRSLVCGATQNPRAAAIAKTVLALGRGLNLLVLAEGVETPEQVNFLKSIDCDLVQGNFFSCALSSERALEFLQKNSLLNGIEQVKLR